MFCGRFCVSAAALCMLVITASARTQGGCDRHATLEEKGGHCRCNPGTSCVGPRCSNGVAAGSTATEPEAVGCKSAIPRSQPRLAPDPLYCDFAQPTVGSAAARTLCLRNSAGTQPVTHRRRPRAPKFQTNANFHPQQLASSYYGTPPVSATREYIF